jgi:hypothetical protein
MINTHTLRIEDSDEIMNPPWANSLVIAVSAPQHPATLTQIIGSPRKLEELAHVLLVVAAEMERKAAQLVEDAELERE